jgi:hypothetical protein
MRPDATHRAGAQPLVLLALMMWVIGQGARGSWPDVPMGHWAQAGIEAMAGRGLLAGYPDGRFGGGDTVTRYELAALLARAWPLAAAPGSTGQAVRTHRLWQDIPARHWARGSVVWLIDGIGVLQDWPGVASGFFGGSRPADRCELAVAVASLLPVTAVSGDGPVAGVPGWAQAAVCRTRGAGVLVGFPDGGFHGDRLVSRYEAATAFYKALAVPAAPVATGPEPDLRMARRQTGPAPVSPLPGDLALSELAPPPTAAAPPLIVLEATPKTWNLPRLSLSFLPEYVSELGTATRGEAAGWSTASSAVQADWADGPLTISGLWRVAQYGLRVPGGPWLGRQDYQFSGAAGYRWRWGTVDRQGEVGVFGLGTYLGRRASGAGSDDLLGMDLAAFGLGMGAQLRWPLAYRLVAVARGEFLPVLGAQFGSDSTVSGQLGLVQTLVGIDWYLDRLSLGLGYRLRYLYDGQQRYSQWANGLQLKAGLAF